MIPCICIDASNKPSDIPLSKWVVEGEIYNIIYVTVLPGNPSPMLAFMLHEVDLDDSCFPYQYYSANRFALNVEHTEMIANLLVLSSDADVFLQNVIA